MIIQIRGTSGSGKSWVMRQLINKLSSTWFKNYIPGRKQPISYTSEDGRMVILGHYEVDGGGCDNVGSAAKVFELIQYYSRYPIIICEGLLLSEDTKWSSQLSDLKVFFLTTPLDTCISQIKSRRLAAGNQKELNTKNTTNRVNVIERARVKLLALGIDCRRVSSKQAVTEISKLIGV